MNKSNILSIALLSVLATAMLSSCSKENIDKENLDPDDVEVVTETTNDTIVVETCNELFLLESELFTIDGPGKAHLFRAGGDCLTDGSDYILNFNVLNAEWDSWGSEPNFYHATDGIPGFAFGLNGNEKVGDTIIISSTSLGFESLVYAQETNTNYTLKDSYPLVLSAVGDSEGEYIGATLTGELVGWDGNPFPFVASFCVPITFVCE